MPTVGEFFTGLAFLASGIIMIIYSRKIVNWFGTSATLERYLGSGGTYTGLRIIGSLVGIIGFLLIIGRMDDVLKSIISLFTK